MVLQPEEAGRARALDESGRRRQTRLAFPAFLLLNTAAAGFIIVGVALIAVALLPDRSKADLTGTSMLTPVAGGAMRG